MTFGSKYSSKPRRLNRTRDLSGAEHGVVLAHVPTDQVAHGDDVVQLIEVQP
jgi:hypothetical protein